MHQTSLHNMRLFRDTLPATGKVLEVGSYDPGRHYRKLFAGWDYLGIDIRHGDNVDLVPADPYYWREIEAGTFDVVISGQMLEHVEYPKYILREISRVLKPGGLACVIAPTEGPEHEPPWYGNLAAEQMREMAEEAALEVTSLKIHDDSVWHDCVLIATKIGGNEDET